MSEGAKKAKKTSVSRIIIGNSEVSELEKNLTELSRSCKIEKVEDDKPVEYIVTYDDIKNGQLIGYGQFGCVKKVEHQQSKLNLAVKMVSLVKMQSNDDRNSQIMDYRIASLIGNKCPSIITFYGAILAEGYVWILSELMDSCIHRFYKKSFDLKLKIPEVFVSKVAYAVVTALEFMKKLKTIHRDIKPSNILINYNGEIKLCDFSISGFSSNSMNFSQKGCKRYTAPEKHTGSGYCIKSDLWSLGISLIEIVTGENPYLKFENEALLAQFILNNDPPKLDSNSFSSELCDFVSKCLIKLREERASCSDMQQHEFIKKYLNSQNDLVYIKHVLNEVLNDPI